MFDINLFDFAIKFYHYSFQKLTDANMEYQKQIEDMKAQIKEAVDMLSGTLMTTSKPR